MSSPALIPAPMTLEQEVVKWTDELYDQIINDREREKENAAIDKIKDYVEGRQWQSNSRFSRSRPVVNKTFRHFWENVGLLTDLALDFQVKLFDGIDGFSDLEELINSLCTFWAMNSDFESTLHNIVCYGMCGSGPAKLQWNPLLNNGMGDLELVYISPSNIAFIGTSDTPQDSECILYYRPVTLNALKRKFGSTADRVKPDEDDAGLDGGPETLRPSRISKDSWARMGSPLKKILGDKVERNAQKYPIVIQKEYWLKDDSLNETGSTQWVGKPGTNWGYFVEPGEPLYPRGRVIVTAGGCVLEDTCNPYWHGKHPFTVFRPYRVPWKGTSGLSPIHPQLSMQNIINRINGGVLDMVNAIIEPTLIAPKAAFPAGDWESLDPGASGGKIKYNNNSPKAPEFAKRAELPGMVFQYYDKIDKESEMSSGASAVSQALGKKQVPGDDALDKIINSRSLPVKVQTRSLTSFIRDVGNLGVPTMLQFYSLAHRVAILGAKGISSSDYRPLYGQTLPAGVKPENFVKKFQFTIKPGSTLASEKSEKIQIAFQLRKNGDLSSRGLYRVLDQNFDWNRNRQELLSEAKDKLLIAGAAAKLTGKAEGGKKK